MGFLGTQYTQFAVIQLVMGNGALRNLYNVWISNISQLHECVPADKGKRKTCPVNRSGHAWVSRSLLVISNCPVITKSTAWNPHPLLWHYTFSLHVHQLQMNFHHCNNVYKKTLCVLWHLTMFPTQLYSLNRLYRCYNMQCPSWFMTHRWSTQSPYVVKSGAQWCCFIWNMLIPYFLKLPCILIMKKIYGSSDFHNWQATSPFMSIKCIHGNVPNGQRPLFWQCTSFHPLDMGIWFYAFSLTQQLFKTQFGKVLYLNYSKRHKLRFKLCTFQTQCWV